MKFLAFIVVITLGSFSLLTQNPCDSKPLFKSGEHGVAYCTTKGTLFSRSVKVVGKNLDVDAKMTWSDDIDQTQIEVSVPLQSFKSGSKKRDKHVAEILGAPDYTGISFNTGWIEADMLCESISQGNMVLPGSLEVKGTRFPVNFDLQFSSVDAKLIVEGSLKTTLSELEVEVPKVGPGGMIAKPHEDLELFVHLYLAKVDGGNALLQCATVDG